MSRFLFVVPPLVGHTTPAAAVAGELARRGHEVAWVASRAVVGRALPAGTEVYDAPVSPAVGVVLERPIRGGVWASLRAFWDEVALPLAQEMAPVVERAIGDFAPDVLVADQHAVAGAVAARRHGLAWATSAATPQATSPVVDLLGGREWLDERFAAICRESGLEPVSAVDLSPRLVLVYSSRELAGGGPYPPSYRFVGPPLEEANGDPAPFPWERLADVSRLYVTLGTTASRTDGRFYATVFAALADEPVQAIVVAPSEAAPAPPPNVLVRPWVPQLELMRRVDAVVCHGGQNTVGQALALGKPLVLAPDSFERGLIAAQAVSAGAGIRVRFGRLRPDELRDAVRRVLDEPSFRAEAERVGRTLREAGGSRAAADALEALAGA